MPSREPKARRLLHQEPAAIAQARAARRLTQTDLANIIGVPRSTVACYEQGQRDADPIQLARIADALQCPVEMLERRRPLSCGCGHGYDPQPNGLTPLHTARGTSDWCPFGGQPTRRPERSAA